MEYFLFNKDKCCIWIDRVGNAMGVDAINFLVRIDKWQRRMFKWAVAGQYGSWLGSTASLCMVISVKIRILFTYYYIALYATYRVVGWNCIYSIIWARIHHSWWILAHVILYMWVIYSIRDYVEKHLNRRSSQEHNRFQGIAPQVQENLTSVSGSTRTSGAETRGNKLEIIDRHHRCFFVASKVM